MADSPDMNPTEVANAKDTPMEDDDITVTTATTGPKTNFIEREMVESVLRYEIPYRKGKEQLDDLQIHAKLLGILANAFNKTKLRLFDNKNNRIKALDDPKWMDRNYYTSRFNHHVDRPQRKTVVVHRILSKHTVSHLKSEPKVLEHLKKSNTFLRAHFWKEDELELKDIGFLISYIPSKHSKAFVKQDMFARTEKLDINWARAPPFQLIHA